MLMENKNSVVIIGAGPAGLSAAETLAKSNRTFSVLEASDHTGGLSATIRHDDFYFDLGGHRFFTKNADIEKYVTDLLGEEQILVDRSSKLLLRGKFFDYPLKPMNAMFGLGISTATSIIINYIAERLKFNRDVPKSLEDWIISQFGTTLYQLFFKTYTEKVWGIPCSRISAQWGVQRIKGLSLRTAIIDAFWEKRKKDAASLLKHFTFPKMGIGVICDKLAETIKEPNRLLLNAPAAELFHDGERITAVAYSGKSEAGKIEADYVISSMPITELVTSLRPAAPDEIISAARWLKYRELVCVALMFDTPFVTDQTWIYVHDPRIDFGRLHEPKNWSRYMAPENKSCVVFEYFCNQGDAVWNSSDEELFARTKRDFKQSNIAPAAVSRIFDYKVVRSEKAYPSYEIGFSQHLLKIRKYLQTFKNLQLIGRYGTYKYNNLDHSIETGIKGAQNLLGAHHDTFMVNIEDEYLEEKNI
jgi:protoporphyrinogen oxidase